MNISIRTLIVLLLSAAACLTSTTEAGFPLVTIASVRVGDPGNVADTSGYGAVTNVFYMGKYEVSISQYAAFLNAVAATNANTYIVNLWHPQMADNNNIKGISRTGSGTTAQPYVYTVLGGGSRPITYVSWFDAARFVNWVHNGATKGAETETGAYTLNGATSGLITKNPGARWWIPDENEWYKASYYKGGSANAGYWAYPTKSDTPPGNIVGSGANQANYYNGVYSTTQGNQNSGQDFLTAAGSFSGSAGPYGTFDQAGNVWEWADVPNATSAQRVRRGGSWSAGAPVFLSSFRDATNPDNEDPYGGFRVASAQLATLWLAIEAVTDLSGVPWRPKPVSRDDVTDDGRIYFGVVTNSNLFYRLKLVLEPQ